MNDTDYMKLAIHLAKKGAGYVAPNPLVGAVVVKNDRIIGTGFHEKYGGFHAERNALASCSESPAGAAIYITLEPCCHHGKQPPCTDALLESGITRVVIGSLDPNPIVSGKGIQILQQNGITVETGVLREECDRLNEVFFHYIKTKLPFVVMKYAMTLDGKIATCTGASQWITGENARKSVHALRHRYSAVMTGTGTVLADDPLLNCRLEGGKNPVRIICDTNLHTPFDSQIVRTAGTIPTILATCSTDLQKHEEYKSFGCHVLPVSSKEGRIDLCRLMERLGSGGIDSILMEGGASLNWSALKSGIVNKAAVYIAPKIFGGASAKTPVGGAGISQISDAVLLKNSTITQIGEDILIESEVISDVHRDY